MDNDDDDDDDDDEQGRESDGVRSDGMLRSRDEMDVVGVEEQLKYVDKVAIVVAHVRKSAGEKVDGLTDLMFDLPLAVMVVKTDGQ